MTAGAMILVVLVVLLVTLGASPAHALCAGLLGEAGAVAVFEGRALDGEALPDGMLVSPATFEVIRYVKGAGPAHVRVTTAAAFWDGQQAAVTSTGIGPQAGEVWRIYVRDQGDFAGVVEAGCTEARRLAGAAAGAEPADPGPPGTSGGGVVPMLVVWVVVAMALTGATLVATAQRRSGRT